MTPLKLDAEVFGDGLAAGEGGDVFEHRLATIAEAGSLDGRDVQRATQLVDNQGRERFAVDILRNDDERLRRAGDLLEQRKQVLHGRDLLLVDEDVGVLKRGFHALGIGDEVGREIAAIELHALNDIKLGLHGAGLFDGDDAILADFVHRLGDDDADLRVRVGGDGADLGDHVAGDGLRELGELAALNDAVLIALADDGLDSLVDAALERHRVGTGGHSLYAFAVDRLGEDGGGGGAVAGYVRGLGGDFANHLGAHVLERIFELDLLGDGHAVLGDRRGTELLLDNNVATLRAEGDLDRVGEDVYTAQDRLPRIFSMQNLLCHLLLLLVARPKPLLLVPGTDCAAVFQSLAAEPQLPYAALLLEDAEDFFFAHDEELIAVELDLGAGVLAEEDAVASLDIEREDLAFVVGLALTDGDHFALLRLFLGGVRDDDATTLRLALFNTADEDAIVQGSK